MVTYCTEILKCKVPCGGLLTTGPKSTVFCTKIIGWVAESIVLLYKQIYQPLHVAQYRQGPPWAGTICCASKGLSQNGRSSWNLTRKFGLSLLTCSWGPANCTCFFSSPTSPQSPWARLWNGVLALSATEIMQKACVGIGAAPLGSTYDEKAVRGGWCLVPDFMFLCSWELPVLPSAALLQSCYSKGHSIDPPPGSCEGRWSARHCIRVQNLDSCTLCEAALEAYSVVWLSAWVRIGSSEMCQAFSQRGLQQRFCLRIVCRNLLGPWSCSEPPDC